MKDLERFGSYRVRVKLRRGPEWRLKPGVEAIDGREITVCVQWRITEEDSSIYAGEWALGSPDLEDVGITWVASGDVEVLT